MIYEHTYEVKMGDSTNKKQPNIQHYADGTASVRRNDR